ncbi:MAG: hypothetical protein K6U89_15650, partial [Chloroflexi bacterium]|nr:hypothetical protein [Chloroflexota bacterium]
NRTFLHEWLKPTNLDFAVLRRLFAQYTADNPHFAGKVEDILAQNLDGIECDISQQELADRDLESDDFVHLGIQQRAELCQLFARNFYFGCEADDPMTAVAFSERLGLQLKPMLGSDISHFDVVDARTVLAEAWELVDRLAAEASAPTRQRMQEAFLISSRFELLFWEAAWRREGWPDHPLP